jgi:subtilisin
VTDVAGQGSDASQAALPAWSLPKDAVERISLPSEWPERVTREWAWGDSTGKGARVCILDSGVEASHPLVGELESAVAISVGEDDVVIAEEDTEGDVSGHGTACAGIVRALAPDCSLASVRVLGSSFTGSGGVLLAGLRYAIEHEFDVINMSLSTTKKPFAGVLHELADSAYFKRSVLVASAHNMPVESYPWRFSSVISVGSHEEADPLAFFYNPSSSSGAGSTSRCHGWEDGRSPCRGTASRHRI